MYKVEGDNHYMYIIKIIIICTRYISLYVQGRGGKNRFLRNVAF